MMALKKKVVTVDAKHFAERFVEAFGRLPTSREFEGWCRAWGGEVEKDKCVFTYVEAL
jgi:hypothetical protein